MKLKFCGANREVTGSCHLLEVGAKKILVDCGMFQGSDFNEGKNFDSFAFDPKEISAVLVTHGHLDHVGRIPKLIKEGFAGKIYMTKGTCSIAKHIWEDAYNVMEYGNRKFDYPVLFEKTDIAIAVSQSKGVDYDKKIEILPGIKAIWKDAGHIFGSAFIEIEAEGKKIGFSGDIGNEKVPILKDTKTLGAVDVLITESTYGNRIHEDEGTRREIILKLLKEGVQKGGTIMVPAFSLERTQELLYELNKLSEHDKTLPRVPIFVDSPLAINILKVFKQFPDYYDQEAAKLYQAGDDFLDFPGLELTYTTQESKKINNIRGPKMVIAGAGMMNGGRILHHAIRYLSDERSTLIIVGYQANGTLGRRLYEGAKKVKIYNEEYPVNCTIKAIGSLSAHGDQEKITNWIKDAEVPPHEVYCVHGEPEAATELAHKIKNDLNIKTYVPEEGDEVEI